MDEEKHVSIKPKSIDSNGVWHWDGKEIPLLGNHMPIPDSVRQDMDPKRQEILAIVDAGDWMEGGLCMCGAKAEGIILVTEFTKLFPAHCCNQMVWMTDERNYNEIYEA